MISLCIGFGGAGGGAEEPAPPPPPPPPVGHVMQYMGNASDFVGAWSFGPNYFPDVAFDFVQDVDAPILGMTLTCVGVGTWSTSAPYMYPVAVSLDGGASLVISQYTNNLGFNNNGQTVRVYACTVSLGAAAGHAWELEVSYAPGNSVVYTGNS